MSAFPVPCASTERVEGCFRVMDSVRTRREDPHEPAVNVVSAAFGITGRMIVEDEVVLELSFSEP